MRFIFSFFKSVIAELLVVFVYIFLINNYLGNVDRTINADAVGYYDYLPSIFIHKDIVRKDKPYDEYTKEYHRVDSTGVYVTYDGFVVNKYPCGTALLESPFFLFTYVITDLNGNSGDGYQKPFQKAVFYAAIFYLFLALYFLKKTLELYDINRLIIILIQLVFVLSTPVTHYANYDAGYSHIYSLFAITAFIYFTKSYFTHKNIKYFIYASVFFGLILILRQVNGLVLFFIPFLAGSAKNLKSGLLLVFKDWRSIFGIFIVVSIFFIQSVLWYLQTGSFLLYSYQGEGFNFLKPEIINILFSYRKGLFVYTPILFFAVFGLIWFVYKRSYYLFFTWIAFFALITYILSSWWSWTYGCSYGSRAYIDYYTVFFIPIAILLSGLPMVIRLITIALALITVPVNIIQTYQYSYYILHWINMDKEKYWEVFLKTDNKYKGILFKQSYNLNNYSIAKDVYVGDKIVQKNSDSIVFNISSGKIPDFNDVDLIMVLFENSFQESDDTRIKVKIVDAEDSVVIYNHSRPLIHFQDRGFDIWQTGKYGFRVNTDTIGQTANVLMEVTTLNKVCELKNLRVLFAKRN